MSEFSKTGNYYYSRQCRQCVNRKTLDRKGDTEKRKLFEEGFKKCIQCNEVKHLDMFPNKSPKSLRESKCSKCVNKTRVINRTEKYYEYRKEYRRRKKEERIIQRQESKRLKEEEKRRVKEILLQERIEKRNLKLEVIRQEKEKKKLELQKKKEYYKTDEYKEIQRQRKAQVKYERWKIRWKNDEVFAMKVRLRNLIRNSFRKKGYSKFEKSTESIVGMNYDDFKKYMESKFLDGMSWENRGEWHIDHIIPLSSVSTEEELIKLCHYTNLQPLWGLDNMRKGNKIL